MLALATHRFTVEEFYRMAEVGVLRPDARVELLDWEIARPDEFLAVAVTLAAPFRRAA
jgi:hypothetical protein